MSEPHKTTGPILLVTDLVVRYSANRPIGDMFVRRRNAFLLAVDRVSFSVGRGELVALVGGSGAGKTSVAQSIAGLTEISAGSVLFDGNELNNANRRRDRSTYRRIQIVYQDPYESLDPRFRVYDTIEEPLRVHRVGKTSGDRKARVAQLLDKVGLSPAGSFAKRFPHELSGGQRQRVAVAAALALGPRLLIADEPVSMLDATVRVSILRLLGDLCLDGLAVLMVTHDISTAAQFANRLLVMTEGRLVEEGPTIQVINSPRHPYTKALLAAVPRLDRLGVGN